MQIQAKQIGKFLAAMVGIAAFTTSAAGSDNITSALTTALSTAGNGGVSVPLQAAGASSEGVITTAAQARVPIYVSGTKDKAQDASGNDIFGVLSLASGVYTMTYYSNVNGTDTAYTWAAATSVDFEIPYNFNFADLPNLALIGVTERHVSPDPAITGDRTFQEQLTVSATNTLSNLSKVPVGNFISFNINGQIVPAGSANGLSVSGQAVTVAATNLGFSITTTDTVYASYSY